MKINDEVPRWASSELVKLGKLSRNEILLLLFVCSALGMWIFATAWIEPAMAALLVIVLMLWTGVLNWNDITSNKPAWNTFAWFATLVALADGLARVGFIAWLGKEGAHLLSGIQPNVAAVMLLVAFFILHYLFASTTAHTTALLPAMLTIAASIPGINMPVFLLNDGDVTGSDGHHHTVRYRPKPDLLRQRLSANQRLLAVGHYFRRYLPGGSDVNRLSVDGIDVLIAEVR